MFNDLFYEYFFGLILCSLWELFKEMCRKNDMKNKKKLGNFRKKTYFYSRFQRSFFYNQCIN